MMNWPEMAQQIMTLSELVHNTHLKVRVLSTASATGSLVGLLQGKLLRADRHRSGLITNQNCPLQVG